MNKDGRVRGIKPNVPRISRRIERWVSPFFLVNVFLVIILILYSGFVEAVFSGDSNKNEIESDSIFWFVNRNAVYFFWLLVIRMMVFIPYKITTKTSTIQFNVTKQWQKPK